MMVEFCPQVSDFLSNVILVLPSLPPSVWQVEGLNEDVLKRLLQLYLLQTGDRDGTELQPYLDPERSLGTKGFC